MKHVTCSCGYVASAETADELLTEVEAHIAAAHAHPHVTCDSTRAPANPETTVPDEA